MNELLSVSVAFGASLALTPLVILGARRWGFVARPRQDRWHRRSTALMGGIAIFGAFVGGALPFLELPNAGIRSRVLGVLVGSALIFLLGLADDLLHIKPGSKLIGQIIAACVLVYSGVYFDILGMPLLTIPLTLLFVVGVTNAFNLLDNMDGLASGVAVICVLTIFLFNQMLGHPQAIGILCLALAGSLTGFLIFNFHPARVFMGDAGAMFLGFVLAAVSILGTWEQASNTFLILAVPVLLLGLPIFDTTFVTITRRLTGRPIAQGGRDHTSHRLVRLGLSERRAVGLLYTVCAAFAAIAVLSLKLGVFAAGIFSILALTVVFVFGVFLSQEKLYHPVDPSDRAAAAPPSYRQGTLIGTMVLHKMRMAEVVIDLLLMGAAYLAAYLIRFEGVINAQNQTLIVHSLPILLTVKFVCFYSFGLYRHLWEFTGIHDLLVTAKAVLTSSLVSVFVLWGLTRLNGYSRAVFVLDALLLLIFVSGSRVLFRVFREWFNSRGVQGRRLLIYGANTTGELLLRELRNDPGLGYRPVGFLDDDHRKRGKRIHGVRIFGGPDRLEEILKASAVEEIVIAMPSPDPEVLRRIHDVCGTMGVICRSVQPISSALAH